MGSTTLDRVVALEDLGHHVTVFDTSRFFSDGNKLALSVGSRLNWGPPLRRLNESLMTAATSLSTGIDTVWFEKARWVWPKTVRSVKEATGGASLIHYSPDPQFTSKQTSSRHFTQALPLFDLVVTTKSYEVAPHNAHGATRLLLVDQGYAPRRHFPHSLSSADASRFASDVTFVGHCEQWYEEVLASLVRRGIRVRIWGPGWQKVRPWSPLRQAIQGGVLWGDDYSKALSGARIALGLLSKFSNDQTTSRTFEIPACGALLMAERTSEHLSLFRNGEEAIFFADADDACSQIQRLLDNEMLRKQIAAAGHLRCVSSGYDNNTRVKYVLDQLHANETLRPMGDKSNML